MVKPGETGADAVRSPALRLGRRVAAIRHGGEHIVFLLFWISHRFPELHSLCQNKQNDNMLYKILSE
jgi:hypothetical protein